MALKYFVISVVILVTLATAVDRMAIPYLVKTGALTAYGWVGEDEKYDEYLLGRNRATRDDPIWRSDAWPVTPNKNKSHRILVVGDSFVWGHGYANMNTIWWRQLARELERRGYQDVEVVAAGMCDTGTRPEFEWIKKLIPQYKPDLTIIGYVPNDPDEIDKKTGRKFVAEGFEFNDVKDEMPVELHNVLFTIWPNLSERIQWINRNIVRNKTLVAGKQFSIPDRDLHLLEGENFEQWKEGIHELGSFVQSNHLPFFVLTTPLNFAGDVKNDKPFLDNVREYYTKRYSAVDKVFADAGVKFVNNLDQLIATIKKDPAFIAKGDKGINPVNNHPNSMATHFYAVSAADEIERDYPQALGVKTAPLTSSAVQVNDSLPPSVLVRPVSKNKLEVVLTHSDDDLLFMPMRKPYFQLNLERPAAIKGFKLVGENLVAADIYLTREDPQKHYDDDQLFELGRKTGNDLSWSVPASSPFASCVNAIKICPELNGHYRRLYLEIIPAKSMGEK